MNPTKVSAALDTRVTDGLNSARAAHRVRKLDERGNAQRVDVVIDGQPLVNFTSNDYLGLAAHPRVVGRVQEELRQHGFGSGSAALLSGRSSLHAELERELARYTGMQSALLFSSGYLANLGALTALTSSSDLIVHDRLNHASLIDGVLASGAQHRRYAHLDAERADTLLQASAHTMKWLVSESVFSMDGDVASIESLDALCHGHGATLYVDDAHGFGVLNDGRGAASALPPPRRDALVTMFTLGKSLGSVGGVVLANASVCEYLVQRARTYIYDTALPPVCAAAALEALAILRESPARPRTLAARVASFRQRATASGIALTASTTPIQPIMIGDDARAVAVAQRLLADGLYVRAIRPPTVPAGTARLRITLTHDHSDEHIERLVTALARALEA
ncbi:MAG: 8-amino-7-oxononanoate synthase [Proteobacteria bacterium]|nr:8-amino-7-oxononanoate synthase [Pseudomonadota bacterium]